MASRFSLIRHGEELILSGAKRSRRVRGNNLIALLFFILLLLGCRPATPPPSAADLTQIAAATITATVAPPTVEVPDEAAQIRNAQYELGAANTLQVVKFSDGEFEQGIPGSDNFISIALTDFIAVGDLDADGTDEIAALVSENYGGTGVFVFLAIYADIDGAFTFQTSTIVDDRPQLNELSIENDEIFLEAVIHGTNDPMCCPTLKTMRHYRFVDNQLDRIDYTTFTPEGMPRTITIESPTNGSEVFSSVQMKGQVAIAPFENNLAYRIFDVSGIELSAGAVAVSAPDLGAPGTFDVVIPLGRALSDSIIRIEVQDLSAADGSLLAMDSVELVVK
jgi:hypothetical protein